MKNDTDISTRLATPDDVEELASMVSGANKVELQPPYNEVDDDFLLSTISAMVASGGMVVAEHDGKIIGLCSFFLHPLYYNPQHIFASSFIRYIAKEFRGQGCGHAMLEAAEKEAAGQGADTFISAVRSKDTHIARALLNKGYRLLESYYAKGL